MWVVQLRFFGELTCWQGRFFAKKKSRGNMSPMEDWSDLVLVSAAPAGRRFPFQPWKVPFMDSVIAIFWSNLSGFVMSIMP